MVKSEELIGIIDYLTMWTRYRIKRCRYNRVLVRLSLTSHN